MENCYVLAGAVSSSVYSIAVAGSDEIFNTLEHYENFVLEFLNELC